ncbi:regulatory protein GemA [Thalassobaculum sp.]|uniref:gp16 family protein n=1 Tax=Thalassobaculum sp. TaxID=2022740 RepID=UPI0032EEAC5A
MMTIALKPAGVDPVRRTRYAKIHIARKALGLDDATYRALLARMFKGRSSSTQLSIGQLDELVGYFKAQGFAASNKVVPRRAGQRPLADDPQARKLRALWITLHQQGVIRDPSEAALAAWVKRTTGVAALQWLEIESGAKAIEGLKSMAARAGVEL